MMQLGIDPRITPEWSSLLKFVDEIRNNGSATAIQPEDWMNKIPYTTSCIKRVTSNDRGVLSQALKDSFPVVVTDALQGWPAMKKWSLQSDSKLYTLCKDVNVICNDRAPARHADTLPNGGGKQRSVSVSFGKYAEYVRGLPGNLMEFSTEEMRSSAPFYLNGWRALVEGPPSLKEDCPSASFIEPIDETVMLLQAINKKLFGAINSDDSWCYNVDANLTKLFIGPPGAMTRLHYDAGEAHGWLGQIEGRKLFILLPPSATEALKPLPTEKETIQSGLDPLQPDIEAWPKYTTAGAIACVVEPGEAVVIPEGWWHWAVALETSITYQRNFYNSGTNAGGLVKMVLETAAKLKRKQ